METNEILKIVAGILVSLGGGGAIILGLSKFIGEMFAKRYEEKIKANFQKELSQYQTQLDILKQTTLRYSDRQFELYSVLWSSLHDLKITADQLWLEANSRNFKEFVSQLKKTSTEIEKASLFIEDSHFEELTEIINQFGQYQIGKEFLIEYRRSNRQPDNEDVQNMIDYNRELKLRYEELIGLVKADLRKQIKGE